MDNNTASVIIVAIFMATFCFIVWRASKSIERDQEEDGK